MWQQVVTSTCALPNECPESILQSSSELLTCLSDEHAASFFGQKPVERNGKMFFYEFLQSIADSSVLVRDGVPQFTDSFLDSQTESLEIIFITYSPQNGVVSTIDIIAKFESQITIDFKVKHFLSVEGQDLNTYTAVAILAFVLSTIILVDKLIVLRGLLKDGGMHRWQKDFAFDVIVQVLMPALYFGIRLYQLQTSRESMLNIVGNRGLGGVPWAAQNVTLVEKVTEFLYHLSAIEEKNVVEDRMQGIYFMFSMLTLLRFLEQVCMLSLFRISYWV